MDALTDGRPPAPARGPGSALPDRTLRALLTPTELAALDPDGARASVIDVEKDGSR